VGWKSFSGGIGGSDLRVVVRGGGTWLDDYGHHPTEIVATLREAREGYGRVTRVLFQPHRVYADSDLMGRVCGGVFFFRGCGSPWKGWISIGE